MICSGGESRAGDGGTRNADGEAEKGEEGGGQAASAAGGTGTRVATAAFWRTFSHEGKKLAQAGEGGGTRPPPLITITITSKVAVYAPAEWADTLTLFHQ